jgi:hypothetical protein
MASAMSFSFAMRTLWGPGPVRAPPRRRQPLNRRWDIDTSTSPPVTSLLCVVINHCQAWPVIASQDRQPLSLTVILLQSSLTSLNYWGTHLAFRELRPVVGRFGKSHESKVKDTKVQRQKGLIHGSAIDDHCSGGNRISVPCSRVLSFCDLLFLA